MSGFPYFEPLKNVYRQVRYFLMSPLARTGGEFPTNPTDLSRRLTLRVTARTIRNLLGTALKRTRGNEEGRFSVGMEAFSEKSPLSIVILQYYGIL